MDVSKELARIALFSALPADELRKLAAIAMPREFSRRASVFSEGEAADGFYVGLSGQIRVFKSSPEGKEQTLHIFGPGHPVGEAAVFANEPYPANAEALDAVKTLFFPKDRFLALVRRNPEMVLVMLATLSKRLVHFARLVEDLALKEIPHRLAAYLLHLAKRQNVETIDLEMSKRHLASVLGTTPETLSRFLAKFARDGAIALSGTRKVRLIDLKYLARVSAGKE